ncbi:MAG: alpha/beta hydrolase-fold protein [Bacteroidota bacterium]
MSRPRWKRILRILFFISIPFLLFGCYVAYLLGRQAYDHFKKKEYAAQAKDTASPTVYVDSVYIDYLEEYRKVFIYLPPDYATDTLRYPVLYFFDGNALFNDAVLKGPEWQLDNLMDSLSAVGGQTSIVVGVMHAKRRTPEYMPMTPPRTSEVDQVFGAKHAQWFATSLKAWVDSSLRTKPEARHTCIGGASLGGLMAYYCLMAYPTVYDQAIVLSPSFWVNDSIFSMHEWVADLKDKRIYLNVGEEEVYPMVPDARKMYKTLTAAGMPSENLRFEIIEDEGHWHPTWRAGVKTAYPWIFAR